MAYHRTAEHSDLKKFCNRLWFLMERGGFLSAKELAEKLYDSKLVVVEQKNTYRTEREMRKNAIDAIRKKVLAHLNANTPKKLQGEFAMAYCRLFKCDADFLLGNIDLPTREDTDINKITGLDDNAIQTLKILKRSEYSDLINFIMSDYAIYGRFLSNLSLYLDNDYDTPIHFDKKTGRYVESEEPEETIMFTNGKKKIAIGKKLNSEVLGFPEYGTIHVPVTILESHALHCIQKQLDEWKKITKKERD